MPPILLVAVGGALGASARYGVSRLAVHLGLTAFPWGTWAVNLAGCFLLGVGLPWLTGGHPRLSAFAAVGFLGAFTTFSAFSLDTLLLLQSGRIGLAALNAVGSVGAGLALVALGLGLARLLGGG